MVSHLEVLVDDVLIQVLSALPLRDLLCLRQTSKRMEVLSHSRCTWHDIFKREVLKSRRPIPGNTFTFTPRLIALCGLKTETDLKARLASTPLSDTLLEFIESWDLEARTLHVIRLERRWKAALAECKSPYMKFGFHPVSACSSFDTSLAVRDLLLLPGGRYAITIHQDRVRSWDLGFPLSSEENKEDENTKKVSAAHCIGERTLPRCMADFMSLMDARSQLIWEGDDIIRIVICANATLTWREDAPSKNRPCIILFIKNGQDSQFFRGDISYPSVPDFAQDYSVSLPHSLQTPSYATGYAEHQLSKDHRPNRFTDGKLGLLLHIHGSLLFFASFISPLPAEDAPIYVGIEVLEWEATSPGEERLMSALLEYPDPEVGEYVGIHVYESAAAIVVVWENCIGLYPIPHFSNGWASLEISSASYRLVVLPISMISLSETIARPITFSTCKIAASDDRRYTESFHLPPSLTILARAYHQPHLLVQNVLSAIPSSDLSNVNSTSHGSLSDRHFQFQLARIPTPMPGIFSRQPRDFGGIVALALGASGRGLRVDANGAIYRCAPLDVALPRMTGYRPLGTPFGTGPTQDPMMDGGASDGGGCGRFRGLKQKTTVVSTVDFWPYRRIDSLPDWLVRSSRRVGEDHGEDEEKYDGRLIVRFDEGMGRIVAVRAQGVEGVQRRDHSLRTSEELRRDDGREEQFYTVAVLDFA